VTGCGSDDPVEERSDFVGVVAEDVFAGDETYREEMLETQAEAGVGLIRQTFDWSRIELEQGRFDFSVYDPWMEQLAEQRMRVLPILFNPPAFHSAKPARAAKRGTYPPKRPEDIAAFARALVERYGPEGSFWEDHDVPKTPIRSWQVWNEPNLPVYWPSGPDAAEYTALLSAAAEAIKEADPQAEVVTAGLPNSDKGEPFQAFLDQMLDAGAGEAADTIAIHPYATEVGGTVRAIRRMRRTLEDRGVEKPIWITEIGWATQGPRSAFTVGMRGQADRITDLFDQLAKLRTELDIRGVVYYNWRDSEPFEGGFDFFGLHAGLLTLNAVEKPGFLAFERGAKKLSR
jgi:hypothetical protein